EISLLNNVPAAAELDALLIFGGDGTVHHQLGFLAPRKIPFLVVPTGSGNDFAVCVGVQSHAKALHLWRSFLNGAQAIRELDLGVIKCQESERYFCNVAGIGLDASANRMANSWPRWLRGNGGYILAALGAMCSEQAQKIEAATASAAQGEWKSWLHESATLVAIGNTQSYGGGMRITPRAQPDDSLLDVCFVRECSALRLLQLFPSVFKGGHLERAEIAYMQAERVRITTPQPMDIYADGEFAGRTPAEFSLQRRALRVIAPPSG
ncbi:MAG TPA: diacylglycerol kinase family protein, partial [Terriglobales bacterium]|nr:diacylglycerol kinase family protein [Terriglobales bacterium]